MLIIQSVMVEIQSVIEETQLVIVEIQNRFDGVRFDSLRFPMWSETGMVVPLYLSSFTLCWFFP